MYDKRTFARYELKFHLPMGEQDRIREIVAPHVCRDPHAHARPDGLYTVRSIYFDSEDLRFYFEKMDSVKVRKKLRVRTYNLADDAEWAFLEIKRKVGRTGFKERVSLPLGQVEGALNGKSAEIMDDRPFLERRILEKFRFNMKVNRLRPVVLVTYEREAFVGVESASIRVTFDQNLRSLCDPRMEDIFDEKELRHFEGDHFVLELKFDEHMPAWMAKLITKLNIHPGPYSKYCHGIDIWEYHAK